MSLDLNGYTGTFQNDELGEMVVSREGNTLWARFGTLTSPLIHQEADTFQADFRVLSPVNLRFKWIKGGGSDRNATDRKEIHPQVVATISRPVNIKGNGMKVQILDLGPNAHVDEHTVTYIRKSRAHALGLTKRFHKGT